MAQTPSPVTQQFVNMIGPKFEKERADRFPSLEPDTIEIEVGQKFDRIVQQHWNKRYDSNEVVAGQRMVHAFVERETGKLIKAASYKAPQKDKNGLAYRYDLSTPDGLHAAVEAADPHGSYLYKR